MVARQDAKLLIKSAFPGHDAHIDHAYRANGSFRNLCQDYRNCSMALVRWRQLSGDEPSQRAGEYAELLVELTKEVDSWLTAFDGSEDPLRLGGAG